MATYIFGNVDKKVDSRGHVTFTERKPKPTTLSPKMENAYQIARESQRQSDASDLPNGGMAGRTTKVTIGSGENARSFEYGGNDSSKASAFIGRGFAISSDKPNSFTNLKQASDNATRRQMFQAARDIGRKTQQEVAALQTAKDLGMNLEGKEFDEWRNKDGSVNIGGGVGLTSTIRDAIAGKMRGRFSELAEQFDGNGGNYDTFQAEQAKNHDEVWRGTSSRPVDTAANEPQKNPAKSEVSDGVARRSGRESHQEWKERTLRERREAESRGRYLFSGRGQKDLSNSLIGDALDRVQDQHNRKVYDGLMDLIRKSSKLGIDLNG